MKPTSVIFIILAAILIVAGVVVCCVAGFIADRQDIELFSDYTDAEGNSITQKSLEDKKVSSIEILLEHGDVNIIGGSEVSYFEMINYTKKSYEFCITDGKVEMNDSTLGSLLSVFKINESGFGFNGLRHYLVLNRYDDVEQTVNVYLTDIELLDSISVTLGDGSFSVNGVTIDCSYTVDVKKGDVTMIDTTTSSKANVTIGKGSMSNIHNAIAESHVVINEQGGIECLLSRQHSFTLSTELGKIFIDKNNVGAEYNDVHPLLENLPKAPEETDASETTETPETQDPQVDIPMIFHASVKSGDISVDVG